MKEFHQDPTFLILMLPHCKNKKRGALVVCNTGCLLMHVFTYVRYVGIAKGVFGYIVA